jgi:hypothetical protein
LELDPPATHGEERLREGEEVAIIAMLNQLGDVGWMAQLEGWLVKLQGWMAKLDERLANIWGGMA